MIKHRYDLHRGGTALYDSWEGPMALCGFGLGGTFYSISVSFVGRLEVAFILSTRCMIRRLSRDEGCDLYIGLGREGRWSPLPHRRSVRRGIYVCMISFRYNKELQRLRPRIFLLPTSPLALI